jgi:ubiquinone/menaquinone biosynthesis C-methylase UbiE
MNDALARDADTGLALSEADWLRIHYQACAAGYVDQLDFCGFAPGSRLIDVGTGPGLFLPELTGRLGSGGSITACDVSPSHLDAARAMFGDEIGGCRITYRLADALDLPFGDDSFDAYWSANVSQYFDDAQFLRMLAEARRVTRAGGRVAVKDWDAALFRVEPSEPGTGQRLMEACRGAYRAGSTVPVTRNIHRAMVHSHVRRLLTETGFLHARQHSTLIQFSAPLKPLHRNWCGRMLGMFAQVAGDLGGPDAAFWAGLRDAPDSLLTHPDFYCCEGSMVGVAVAP